MHKTRFVFRCVVAILTLGSLCGCTLDGGGPPPAAEAATEAQASSPAPEPEPEPATEEAAYEGAFRVVYTPLENGDLAEWEAYVRQEQLLEQMAEGLNGWIALPTDVDLTYRECGQANAFYQPDAKRIVICYEIMEKFGEVFAYGRTDEERERALLGATHFVFYHELGHALVDVLDLPVLGREEDAADQLAAYVLANGTEEGEQAAIDGGVAMDAVFGAMDESAFADTHSLGRQRFYNVACWVYGHDPEKHASYVFDGVLPESRAASCPFEYARIEASWSRLLEPFLRPQP